LFSSPRPKSTRRKIEEKEKRASQKRGKTKSIAAAINPFQVSWPSYSVDFLHLWNFLCSCIKACAISVSKLKMFTGK